MLALGVNARFNTALAQREEKKQTASHLAAPEQPKSGSESFLKLLPYFWVLRRGAETLVRARRERRVSYDEVLKHIACSRP